MKFDKKLKVFHFKIGGTWTYYLLWFKCSYVAQGKSDSTFDRVTAKRLLLDLGAIAPRCSSVTSAHFHHQVSDLHKSAWAIEYLEST